MMGIVSYGTYIPTYRVSITDIAAAWKKNPQEIVSALGVKEKTVPGVDEDAVTIAFEAVFQSMQSFKGKASDIEALLIGSESHPYAVNPTSTIVGEFLGIGNNYLASDLEFACKAGTAGIQMIAGLLSSGQIKYGLAVGTDTAQSKPHDALEYTSASAGVAVLMGKTRVCTSLLSYTSYSSDTPDFWRRDGIRYPSHAGRFTGEPAYFAHVVGAAMQLMKKTHVFPKDIDYCVFHMPNGKFPREVARRLGFIDTQLAPSLTVDHIGNPYSASSMMGLAAVLDIAKPNKKIFMVSYGSGAGSDAFLWKTTEHIKELQTKRKKQHWLVSQQIEEKTYVDYLGYLKQTHKI
ncbi:MAG: hydroxymethylglutaryl-CoA synthase [Candidatus Gottesmanbacteria bacterium]